jgi:hypothetical protein
MMAKRSAGLAKIEKSIVLRNSSILPALLMAATAH